MGYTVFYEEAKKEISSITWRDILGESFKRHKKGDLEYALAAGSIHDTADPDTMLRKWHKPWVWSRLLVVMLAVGLAFSLIAPYSRTGMWIPILFFTLALPFSSMLLVWELNVPRNISLFYLMGIFVGGGAFSLVICIVLALVENSMGVIGGQAYWAPLFEEPAKFLAALFFLQLMRKSGTKIYGCTGLTVAAGVGTGFTVFESIGYNFDQLISAGSYAAILSTVARSVGINAHMMYCIPYVTAFALTYHRTGNWKKALTDKYTIGAFIFSCFMHGLWNYLNSLFLIEIVIIALTLAALLYAIKQCLREVVQEGSYKSGQGINLGEETKAFHTKNVMVISVGSVLNGAAWPCKNSVLIGKMDNCDIKFPADTPGLSRIHCRLTDCGSYWTICDMGSSYGTYVNGVKLDLNKEYKLAPDSLLELGSSNVQLKIQ